MRRIALARILAVGTWTVEDGLPLSMVWALEQARDGTLWVGTAEFTNLDAGTHRFEVQATINGETWYRLAQPLRFTVAPHLYETRWFRLLVVLAFSGLVGDAYRWRTYRLRKRRRNWRRPSTSTPSSFRTAPRRWPRRKNRPSRN